MVAYTVVRFILVSFLSALSCVCARHIWPTGSRGCTDLASPNGCPTHMEEEDIASVEAWLHAAAENDYHLCTHSTLSLQLPNRTLDTNARPSHSAPQHLQSAAGRSPTLKRRLSPS